MNDRAHSHRDNESVDLPFEVEAWLNEQPSGDAEMLKEVWQLAGHAQKFDPPGEPDTVRFERMRKEVKEAVASNRSSMRLIRLRILKAAAVVLVLMIAGGIWWTRPIVHEAPFGSQLTVLLPDGSESTLNSGSRLSHTRSFGTKNRLVNLQGEGFFDVKHNEIPFSVETFNGSVAVLGTRFNVRAWEDETRETVVVLQEGSVRLAGHDKQRPVVLEPGELSRISGEEAVPSEPVPVDVDLNLAWRSGNFIFVDELLGVVVDEAERRFDVSIQVQPQTLRQERITLKLNDAKNIDEILTTISEVRGYTFELVGGVYRLANY